MTAEDDMLAAEYALGLLDGDERAAARARLSSDPAFARDVAFWEDRLAGLAAELPSEAPSPRAKAALMTRLFPEPERPSFWRRTGLWQLLAAGAVAVAAFAFLVDAPAPVDAPTTTLYSGEIVSEAGDFRVVALVDKARDEVILTRTAGAAPEGRILQVWAHGPGEPALSVGLWPEGETVRLPLPPTIAAVRGTLTLGVSEEPPGGSPTGSPSGRVFGTVDIPGVAAPA